MKEKYKYNLNSWLSYLIQLQISNSVQYVSSGNSFFAGSPNNKVLLGMIGTNSRGSFLAKTFAKLPNVEIGYICDPDSKVLERTIGEIEK